jgi:serine protease Do
VFAFGHPLGHANALSAGVLHAVSTTAPSWIRAARPGARVEVVQADVRLLPGNSGGPLTDAAGGVLGVNAMVVGGLGIAISVREVERLVRRHRGAASPAPTLGVRLRPVTVRSRMPAEERPALLVLEVGPDSAAARAGLLAGDVLLAANDRPLHTSDDLADALARAGSAGALTLDAARAGRAIVVSADLSGAAREVPRRAA